MICSGCKDLESSYDTLEGLCMLCAAERLRENARLRKAILDFGNADGGFDWAVLARIEKLEEALKEITETPYSRRLHVQIAAEALRDE